MTLTEIDGCVYIREEYERSHGFHREDSVGSESFMNHVHIDGDNHVQLAERSISALVEALRSGWPDNSFRIYHQIDQSESIVRFHMVRDAEPNFCEEGGQFGESMLKIIEV